MGAPYVFDAARRANLAARWSRIQVVRNIAEAQRDARAMLAKKEMYAAAAKITGVPWWMIAVIDAREGGISNLGTRHLHNGDLLSAFTRQVPAGRPHVGHGPPFTWLESAVDALQMKWKPGIPWTIERALHELEPYNGLKYYFANRPSPYIWSCTPIYDPPTGPGGKVTVDHGPIENVVDKQIGCAALLFSMGQLDHIAFPREGDVAGHVAKAATATAAAGVGAGAGAWDWLSTHPVSTAFLILGLLSAGVGLFHWLRVRHAAKPAETPTANVLAAVAAEMAPVLAVMPASAAPNPNSLKPGAT